MNFEQVWKSLYKTSKMMSWLESKYDLEVLSGNFNATTLVALPLPPHKSHDQSNAVESASESEVLS